MTVGQGVDVFARLVDGAAPELLGPSGAAWSELPETALALTPTPLDRQPSAYVQAAWAAKPFGLLANVGLTAAVTSATLFVRLRWEAAEPRSAITDNNVFADAAAVLFPANGVDAPLETMGDEQQPVHAWHWRAGTTGAFVVTATGLGTTVRLAHHAVEAAADWANGRWTLVLSRPLSADTPNLARGGSIPIGVAVWSGARGERAGLKSHTPGWTTLALP